MLESLKLFDFQSHRVSKLVFSPGVNVITGQSDSGKTSLIRALRWVWSNRPSGDSFLRHGEKEVIVKVKTDDGHRIVRSKKPGENAYQVNGSSFTAVGAGVPEEVAKALNLEEINWQGQLDRPGFILAEGPSEVSRQLNEMAGLEVIDRAFSNLGKMKRRCDASYSDTKDELEKSRKILEETPDVKEARGQVDKLEKLAKEWNTARDIRSRVGQMTADINEVLAKIRKLKKYTQAEEEVDNALGMLEDLEHLEDRKDTMEGIQADLDCQRETIKELKRRLEKEEKELAESWPDECPLCGQSLKGRKE